MKLVIRSCELKDANAFIAKRHRHHKPVQGHRFSQSLWIDELVMVGVAITGRPVARAIDHHRVVEVTRLCTDGMPNACSALYSAAARAAKELGYDKIQTYILDSESGVSLKAAGWVYEQTTAGGDWNCEVRKGRRTDQPQEPKQRWARVLR